MKIAFIFPPMWNPLSSNSLGIWNYNVTSILAQRNDILVYSGLYGSQERAISYQGVRYRHISTKCDVWMNQHPNIFFRGSNIYKPAYTSVLFFIGYALNVARDLRQQRCDIVHVYNYPQFIPIIKRFNPSIHVVLNVHGELLSQFEFEKIKRYLGKADRIVSCSEFISEKVRALFPLFSQRCETIFMGVDPDSFFPKKAFNCENSSQVKRLLYVGRLSPEKGAHLLVEAFPKVVDHYPEALLDIVGPPGRMPMEYLQGFSLPPSHVAELKELYSKGYGLCALRERIPPNLSDRVRFRGLVSHNELPGFYNNSDVYVNPSYYESFGMSNIEAMACGVPVVATRAGAVPEVVEEGKAGILVEPGNSLALADGIIRILDDTELRRLVIKVAREKAVKCFSWQCVSQKLYELYSKII